MQGDKLFETQSIIRLGNQFREMNSRQIIEAVKKELNAFLNGNKKSDDLTIMLLKKK